MTDKPNSMQAMLNRAKEQIAEAPAPAPSPAPARSTGRGSTKLIGGHFPPAIAQQLRMIAAEEGTTIQSLLAEALDDLFTKKAKGRGARK